MGKNPCQDISPSSTKYPEMPLFTFFAVAPHPPRLLPPWSGRKRKKSAFFELHLLRISLISPHSDKSPEPGQRPRFGQSARRGQSCSFRTSRYADHSAHTSPSKRMARGRVGKVGFI